MDHERVSKSLAEFGEIPVGILVPTDFTATRGFQTKYNIIKFNFSKNAQTSKV